MMSMRKGANLNFPQGQILNTGSLTNAKLVGFADALGIMLWTKYFMKAQGYTIVTDILFQDNKSTILLVKSSRQSAGKKSKHIKNRYVLIPDKVAHGDVEI